MSQPIVDDEILAAAKSLVAHIEASDERSAQQAFAEIGQMMNVVMYQEVGRLTRTVHESLKAFMADDRLKDLAESEIPNAAERLRYVMRMTEQAANRTLSSVEDSLPLAEQLGQRATQMTEYWERSTERELSIDQCRTLSGDLNDFFATVKYQSDSLYQNLSDVQVTQGFQDLTGQIIWRVITLVTDVEEKLVDLMKVAGEQIEQLEQGTNAPSSERNTATDIEAHGPAVPGVDKGSYVNGQDDVDELLSSLGF